MKQKPKFCTRCGTLMVQHDAGSYNEKTGKPNRSFHCTNLKCEHGCNYAGHVYSWFFSQTCKRCGQHADDYLP